jgi:hypothetical protein
MSTSTSLFWVNDPFVLVQTLEIWPQPSMTFQEKMNAISRLVFSLSFLGFLFTQSIRFFVIGIVTLSIIAGLYFSRNQKNKSASVEGFDMDNSKKKQTQLTPQTLYPLMKEEFKSGTKNNPFGNVLLTEITDDPERNPAPPSFNVDVHKNILKHTKQMVQQSNPDLKDSNKLLFSSLTDQFDLDQSSRIFHSTANTRVANDQGAYAQWLYGSMPSSKESNFAGAVQRVADSYRYTLY